MPESDRVRITFCEHCGQEVQWQAIRCKHCGKKREPGDPSEASAAQRAEEETAEAARLAAMEQWRRDQAAAAAGSQRTAERAMAEQAARMHVIEANAIAAADAARRDPWSAPMSRRQGATLTFVLVALLVWEVIAAVTLQRSDAVAPPTWEYRVESFDDGLDWAELGDANSRGREGWEIITARRAQAYGDRYVYECILRRRR